MVHGIESKNRAAACVPEHKGVEESELTRPRAGEAQGARGQARVTALPRVRRPLGHL